MQRYISFYLCLVMIGLSQSAWAGDEEYFVGLIPGVPVADAELADLYGTGGIEVNVTLADGSLLNLDELSLNNAPVDNSSQSNNTSVFDNSGIAQVTPIAGDGNTVNNFVLIEVKINTVELSDISGSSLNLNQTLDFGGLVTFFSN